ncbi:MAG: hypothetical protein U0P30_05590 [Vicinamibacterales bacterium]
MPQPPLALIVDVATEGRQRRPDMGQFVAGDDVRAGAADQLVARPAE